MAVHEGKESWAQEKWGFVEEGEKGVKVQDAVAASGSWEMTWEQPGAGS